MQSTSKQANLQIPNLQFTPTQINDFRGLLNHRSTAEAVERATPHTEDIIDKWSPIEIKGS